MTPTNDAPVTVEPAAELAEMLLVGTETGAFDHTPEEIGLHVMENAQAILNALASPPAGDGVEEEADDGPCTDCHDTGVTIQTERPCSCAAAALACPHSAVAPAGDGDAIEAAARAMCDRVNGIGDYDENIEQRRPGWTAQAKAALDAAALARPRAAVGEREA